MERSTTTPCYPSSTAGDGLVECGQVHCQLMLHHMGVGLLGLCDHVHKESGSVTGGVNKGGVDG